jgi:hypothetical protein
MIFVEIKVSGTEEEARVQIGMWLSAWHERVGQLRKDESYRVITLPVIIVLNHYCISILLLIKSHTLYAHSDHCSSSILTLLGNFAVHGKHGRYAVACESLPDTGCAPALGRVGIGDIRALV